MINSAEATDTAEIGHDNGTYYCGFALRETGSSGALVYIRDTGAADAIIDVIAFAADESVADYYGGDPIRVCGKILVDVNTGAVEGCIRYK